MKSTLLKIIFALTLFSLSACAGGGTAASLENTSWQLVSLNGDSPVVNTAPSIAFEDGQVSGNSSCNTYGGEYKLKGDTIEFGMLMSTMMACADPAAMDQEQAFLAFLGSVERWELRDGTLLLFRADGDALVFEPQN